MFFTQLKAQFQKIIQQSYPNLVEVNCNLVPPPNPELGHFAFGCFSLAKQLQQAPQQIAKKIAQDFSTSYGWIAKIQNEGAYLNLFLDYKKLGKVLLAEIITNPHYEKNTTGKTKKVLLEFSSPNTNKPLHLGHARNNSIGFTLSKILELAGYEVIKANLINDRGIHICQAMLAYSLFGKGKTPESEKKKSDHFVGDYYVLFHQKKENQPELLEQAQALLQKWEAGHPETKALWEKITTWALTGIQQTYKRCNIEFDQYYFESQTYHLGKKEVENAFQKKLCQRVDGAIVISLEQEGLGQKVLLRKDNTAVYITQDIFTTIKKYQDYAPDECLFVVGSEQQQHFQVLFAVLKKFGYEWTQRCKHLSYGMIFLPEGKMKSREGKIVDLDNLLNQVKELAFQELQKRATGDRSEAELLEVAEKIAQAAVKFFILRTHSKKDFVFDAKNSLNFEGNTGPYLQYTYARINSVLNKQTKPEQNLDKVQNLEKGENLEKEQEWNEEERQILQSLLLFPSILEKAANEYEPSFVASFVLELCRNFNKFYYQHPILKNKHEQKRIQLALATQIVLEKCLLILGIPVIKKM